MGISIQWSTHLGIHIKVYLGIYRAQYTRVYARTRQTLHSVLAMVSHLQLYTGPLLAEISVFQSRSRSLNAQSIVSSSINCKIDLVSMELKLLVQWSINILIVLNVSSCCRHLTPVSCFLQTDCKCPFFWQYVQCKCMVYLHVRNSYTNCVCVQHRKRFVHVTHVL